MWKNIIKTPMRRWTWRFCQTGTKTDPFVKSKMCQTLKWAFFKYYFMLSWQWALLSGSAVKNLSAIQVMKEMLVQSLGQEVTLEEEMATHCSILAWKIPWTERPGGLQSLGSRRIRYDLVTKQQQQPPRLMEIKTKINMLDLIKLKSFHTGTETVNKTKRQPI